LPWRQLHIPFFNTPPLQLPFLGSAIKSPFTNFLPWGQLHNPFFNNTPPLQLPFLGSTGFLSPGPSSFPGTCSFPYFGLFSGCQDWVSLLYFCLSGQVIPYNLVSEPIVFFDKFRLCQVLKNS